jgi:periplasmic copper chaperone A
MSTVRPIGMMLVAALAVVASGACGGSSDTAGEVAVEAAWVREPAAGQTTVAVYATVVNGTDHAVTLVDATSPLSGDVSVHETVTAGDGTMSMGEPVDGVRIEAGTSFVLEPGGAHVMLDGVEAGDVVAPVEVTFVFAAGSDGGSDAGLDVTVEAEVRPLDGATDLPGFGAGG